MVIDLGLQTQVQLVEGDINDPKIRKQLPEADLVPCSTASPWSKWKDALKSMLDLVKPGNLALLDFVTREGGGNWDQEALQVVVRHGRVYFNTNMSTGFARKRACRRSGTTRRSRGTTPRATPRTTSTSAKAK